jgi:TPR repeat protein
MIRISLRNAAVTLFAAAAITSSPVMADSSAEALLAAAHESLACGSYADASPRLIAAANAGSLEAHELLGWLYYEGERIDGGLARDAARAARWLQAPAEAGRPEAQHLLTALELEGDTAARVAQR